MQTGAPAQRGVVEAVRMVRLGEVCEFRRGLTYSKADETAVSSNVVLRANNIDLAKGELDLTDLKYLKTGFAIPAEKTVVPGSILMCMANGSKAHLGKVALIRTDLGYAFGGFMGLLVPKDVEPEYLFAVLNSSRFKSRIFNVRGGTSIHNLTFSDISGFVFPLPPLPEQKQIAAELELIHELKANTETRLLKLDTLVKSRFVEMFGDPITNPRSLPLVPFLEALSDETSLGTKFPSEGYLPTGKYPIVDQGQNVIAGFRNEEQGIYSRVPAVIFGDHTCCLKLMKSPFFLGADGTKILHPDETRFDAQYLFRCLQFFKLPDVGYSRHFKWLKEFRIPAPPLSAQRVFAAYADQLESMKDTLRETVSRLDTLYRAKLQEYFG